MLAIRKIESWACTLPLPQPIDLGRILVRERTHLCLRVHTAQGLVADGVTQSRGAPLDAVLCDVLAPHVLGRDALGIETLRSLLERALTANEFDGAIGRAWSALELCLHDLRAQAAGWPLWRMFGGAAPAPVPVELVEGYGLADESDAAFADRLAARIDQGFTRLKLEAGHYASIDPLLRRLDLLRQRIGPSPGLILDFAWSWPDAKTGAAIAKRLEPYGIEWIEDPFARTARRAYRRLRDASSIPIGGGDEATRPDDLAALLDDDAVDLLRLDVTTLGGYGPVLALAAQAKRGNVRVSFHEHPEFHEHCVFGFGAADHVEIFPTDRPFDRVHALLQDCSFDRVERGLLHAADRPGTGVRLRGEAVAAHARRHRVVEA